MNPRIAENRDSGRHEKDGLMFILRVAFWLSVVIMLLPADPEAGAQAPRVGAMEALTAARTAVSDLSGFCERNPAVCETGGSAFKLFTEKVRYNTRRLYDYFDDKSEDGGGGATDTLGRDDATDGQRKKPEAGQAA